MGVHLTPEQLQTLPEAERLTRALRMFVTPRPFERRLKERLLLASGTALHFEGGLAATSWGEGPPVLLVHGWDGRGTDMAPFVAPLVAAGRRAIALDGPAHGDSAGSESSMVRFAEAIGAVGAELGELARIVGHSVGAGATVLALDRGLTVRRAVLIAAPATVEGIMRRFLHILELPENWLPAFQAMVEAEVGVPAAALDLVHIAGQQRIPALVVHADDDREVPVTDAQAIARAWPGARLYRVSHCGHRRILLVQAVVDEAVKFLLD